jgi:hypothetical protein
VRELDSRGDRDHLQHSDLPATVTSLDAAMALADVAPGQLGELATQPGLVALHRQHPVRAAGMQVGDVLALCVQRVGSEDRAGQVEPGEGVEQRSEPVDLAGLAVDSDLPEHNPSALINHREQVPACHLRSRWVEVA